jgi:hypothetical protein
MDGEKDHVVPWAIANASYKRHARNKGVTEIVKIPNRGHALTIDNGWREVADTALAFVHPHVGFHASPVQELPGAGQESNVRRAVRKLLLHAPWGAAPRKRNPPRVSDRADDCDRLCVNCCRVRTPRSPSLLGRRRLPRKR